MSQHTPGPWQLNGSTISGRDPLDLRGNYNESPVCTISHGWRNPDIDSANARLIAKAPEMAALLGKVIQWQSGQPIEMLLDEARALLLELDGEET